MNYLKLIRYQNLLILAFMQIIVRYGFLTHQNIPLALNHFQFGLLVLATVLIAAGGYIINDIFNLDSNAIHKPNRVLIGYDLSENRAYNLYFGCTVIGVFIGFYLSNTINLDTFAGAFIITAALLYLYANSLKQIIIIGNLIIAFLLAFSVIIIALFDLLPVTFDGNRAAMGLVFKILLDYAFFAFSISFIREIVKNLEDVAGNMEQDSNSLPATIGISNTTKIVFGIALVFTTYLLYYIYQYYFINKLIFSTIYTIIFVLAPLVYFIISITRARYQSDFKHLSRILKIILIFGILSILVVNFNLAQNV